MSAAVWRLLLLAELFHAVAIVYGAEVAVPAVPDGSTIALAASTSCTTTLNGAEDKLIPCEAAHFFAQEPVLAEYTSGELSVMNPIHGCEGAKVSKEADAAGKMCLLRRGQCSFDEKVAFAIQVIREQAVALLVQKL